MEKVLEGSVIPVGAWAQPGRTTLGTSVPRVKLPVNGNPPRRRALRTWSSAARLGAGARLTSTPNTQSTATHKEKEPSTLGQQETIKSWEQLKSNQVWHITKPLHELFGGTCAQITGK